MPPMNHLTTALLLGVSVSFCKQKKKKAWRLRLTNVEAISSSLFLVMCIFVIPTFNELHDYCYVSNKQGTHVRQKNKGHVDKL
jgi:hypothetical protein